jgi:polygalacturonase
MTYRLVFAILFVSIPCVAADEIEQFMTDLPFKIATPQFTLFGDRDFPIDHYGAVGDGHTLNTAAFAKAIEACAASGGGKVVVPPGIWLTGPIKLAGNINLHLQAGSTILFSRRLEDYAANNGDGQRTVVSPISGKGLENIAITGQGVIDGSGDAWRPVKKGKMTENQWKALLDSGGGLNAKGDIWYPSKDALKPGSLESMRPRMIELVECKRILLDGPTFQNSPSWNIHPLLCEDVIIRNITVLNPWYSQNGDGLDIDACRRVLLYRSHFDVGDDAICLKSGKDEPARRRGRACEDIVIRDCVVYHGHGGITIGSEMSGGVRNVYADNCTFFGTDLGLRFKSTRGRGGVVENLFFNHIYMRGIPTDAIGFTMSYGGQSPEDMDPTEGQAAAVIPKVDEGTPVFRNIHFKNIVCSGAKRAVRLVGLPEMPITGIEFTDMTISAQAGFECLYAKDVRITNARIVPGTGSVFSITDSSDITIQNAVCPMGVDVFLTLSGAGTGGIHLVNTDTAPAKKDIVFEQGVRADAVSIQPRENLVTPEPSSKTVWDYPYNEPPIAPVKPLLDVGLRDTAITQGPDNTYYLTGTLGPDFMIANEGICIWKSGDLKQWEPLGLVWSFERDGTWQKQWTVKNGQRRRAVWAPEVHYLKGNFYIAYSVTGLGTGLLRSTTGKAEGPYKSVNTPEGPMTSGIDATLFQDDDGSVYFLYGSGMIARMKDDLSGLAEALRRLRCEPADTDPEHHHPARPESPSEYDHVGFEGAFLFKTNGRYYLSGAERYYERYHCMTAESKSVYGPYSAHYVSVPHAGHNTFFQDAKGQWWSTMFGNDAQAPIRRQAGILRIEFDADGHIRPLVTGEIWQPKRDGN